MRLHELFESRSETPLDEGGASGAVRYNSELGMLFALAGNKPEFDPTDISGSFDMSKISGDKEFLKGVDSFLLPNYNKKIFDLWTQLGHHYRHLIKEKLGEENMPSAFRWVGGSNVGPAADIEFVDSPVTGISIKDKGGITLKNLTPKALGLDVPRGIDVFAFYAEENFYDMKRNIFQLAMADARKTPDEPLAPKNPKYNITYNSETEVYTCHGKNSYKGTEQDILNNVQGSAAWQRPFGDWMQANWSIAKQYATPMYVSVSETFEKIIEEKLQDSEALHSALAFEEKSYFYATPKDLYYVPGTQEVPDLRLKSIKYAEPDGTSQSFIAEIGSPDSNDNCEITIYIRYANGMFEANPTVRVQSIKNPEHIAWEQLTP